MAKYLREIANKDVGTQKTPKAVNSGDNSSSKEKMDIDDFNAAPGNRDFARKHEIQKHSDRNGNDDGVFKGKKEAPYKKQSANVYESKKMTCESCGSMYEGESCGCGKSVPEAKPGKKGMLVDKKKLSEMLRVNEGAKVDRMVKHIKASEKAAGKSEEKAENIAWATANKRGMLNNKNKKVQEQAPADTPMKITYPSDEVGQVGRV